MQVENHHVPRSYQCVCEEKTKEIIDDGMDPSVKKAISSIIHKEGYHSYNIQTKLRKTDGSNYLSKSFEVDVTGRTDIGTKETNLFIKHTLSEDALPGIVDMKEVFSKEIFYYTDLMAIYEKLQKEADIPSNQMLKYVKCYTESNSEAIIMDNLNRKGYKMLHRAAILPLSFAQLSVKEIAKFHALSMILQRKMPEYFDRKVKSMRYSVNANKGFKTMAANMLNTATQGLEESMKNKIRKDCDAHIERYIQYFTDNVSNVNCLCHGDYRLNNILLKEVDGEATEVIPIDFQTIFYGSPLVDLAYLIYMNSDRAFRQQHEDELKELYFETLKQFLQLFDVDIEEVFPKKQFDEEYLKIKVYGLYVCMFILPLMYAKESDLPEFENMDASDFNFEVYDKYYDLLTELWEDLSYLLNV